MLAIGRVGGESHHMLAIGRVGGPQPTGKRECGRGSDSTHVRWEGGIESEQIVIVGIDGSVVETVD